MASHTTTDRPWGDMRVFHNEDGTIDVHSRCKVCGASLIHPNLKAGTDPFKEAEQLEHQGFCRFSPGYRAPVQHLEPIPGSDPSTLPKVIHRISIPGMEMHPAVLAILLILLTLLGMLLGEKVL